jgi:crossover junction endodeoxyribonuclease RusA
MITLEIPWSPSVNHYWRVGHGRIYLSPEGVRYKLIVAGIVREARVKSFTGPVSLLIDAYPPDRRIRDLDNVMKALLDALGGAGLYRDDSQIKHINAWMLEPIEGGKLIVTVSENPRRDNPLASALVPCN